jgi:hypothetical protein
MILIELWVASSDEIATASQMPINKRITICKIAEVS